MIVLWERTSTNGRWGLTIVGIPLKEIEGQPDWPAEGSLELLGDFNGHITYEFKSDKTGQWILPCGDVKPIDGCEIIEAVDLQSYNVASIVMGGEFFVIEKIGYKGIGTDALAFNNGKEIGLPAFVMAAMGLIPNERKKIIVEIPPLQPALLVALEKAGIK